MTAPLVLLGAFVPAAPAVISRVVRLASLAGLNLPSKPKDVTAALEALRQELTTRGARLLWDGRAFLIEHRPEDTHRARDLDRVTLLFDELCAAFAARGVRLPPAVEAAADEELAADCHHAWRVARALRAPRERNRGDARAAGLLPPRKAPPEKAPNNNQATASSTRPIPPRAGVTPPRQEELR